MGILGKKEKVNKMKDEPKKENEAEDFKTGEVEPEVTIEEVSIEENGTDKQKQIDEMTDRLQRTMADFDNFRKRTQKERATMHGDGVRDTVAKLLPIIDNFERAMQSAQDKDDAFYKGIAMIYNQLSGMLSDLGVEAIADLHESFNPEIHFAVSHIDDNKYDENLVIEVLQKGYKYQDKVIRPSMVRVAN